MPVLFALTNETSGTLSNLVFNSGLTTEDIASIRSLVIENRGVTLAEEKAWEYGQDALKALEKVKKSESRKILEKIVSSILETTRK
ncbi:hypothetical protein SDC9_195022 [bioreactor metagenome]|uniref:Uncharacterized protein n=1 Tax=bioreactor metagenome TaxID=1076179 RepID=A0A645I8G6_9ZZZZ